jgi:hypothetical protein
LSFAPVVRATAVAVTAILLQACAPGSFTFAVKAPQPSGLVVEGSGAAATLTVVDSRPAEQREFFTGRLPAAVNYGPAPIDPPAFLAEQLKQEFQSRGIKWDVVQGAEGAPKLDLRAFRMVNQRVSAYSPFVTYTYLSADLVVDGKTHRVGSFVTRGKVPVWTFDEVIEPTLSDPMSIAVKELAAKIARATNARSSDKAVADLVAKLSTRGAGSFMDVYALGFTNNPKAIDIVADLTNDGDEYVKLAAISSLGTLGAIGKFEQLKAIHQDSIGDKFSLMALKSIGDLGTPEAKAYLAAVPQGPAGEPTAMILSLHQ